MIHSMTAYGRKEVVLPEGTISCELRSVNHRYLDLSFRLSEELRPLEPLLRTALGKRLSRGKIECNMRFHRSEALSAGLSVNQELARQVIAAGDQINQLLGSGRSLRAMDVLQWRGVVEATEVNLDPLREAALTLANETLEDYVATREREGEKITALISGRCTQIGEHVAALRLLRPKALSALHDKLRERVLELQQTVDPQRLEQELVILAQKLDVDEELDRLDAHLSEINAVLERDEPVGRRLDFLMQELNREGNTLSSKSHDTDTTRHAVDIKVLIEQMREQIQNIE